MKKLMFFRSFTAALLAQLRGGGNVLCFIIFVMLVGRPEAVAQTLKVDITQPNVNVALYNVHLNAINAENVGSINNNLPDDGRYINAHLLFSFYDGNNILLFETSLPISFYAQLEGNVNEWHVANFIHDYSIGTCSTVNVKKVVVTMSIDFFPILDIVNSVPDMEVTFPNAFGSGANITLSPVEPNFIPVQRTATYATSLPTTQPISVSILPSLYFCGNNTYNEGFLLYALPSGGCPTSISPQSLIFSPYEITWSNNASSVSNIEFEGSIAPAIGFLSDGTLYGAILGEIGQTYTVTVTDNSGNSSTASYTVAAATPAPNTAVISNIAYPSNCSGNAQVTLHANLTQGSQLAIGYYSGSGIFTTSGDPAYIATNTGIVDITVPVPMTAPSWGDTYILRIKSTAEGAFCPSDEVHFFEIPAGADVLPLLENDCIVGLSTNEADSYAWSNGATTQSISNIQPTNYSVSVTDNGHCSVGHLTISPEETVVCCLDAADYLVAAPYTVTTSGVWDNDNNELEATFGTVADNIFQINAPLIIPNGVTLEINGMEMHFGRFGKILVKKGGKLTIDACTLDGISSCNAMWQGIQVEGTNILGAPVSSTDHGTLICRNNTHIKNAIVGVANTRFPNIDFNNVNQTVLAFQDDEWELGFPAAPSENFQNLSSVSLQELWSLTARTNAGGVILISDTEFYKCFHGVNVSWKGNKSNAIERCRFVAPISLESLAFPFNGINVKPEAGIQAINVNYIGTKVDENQFQGLKYGIRANNVKLLSVTNSIFHRTSIGVSARQVTTAIDELVTIKNNTFGQCIIAIQGDGIDNAIVKNNQVNVLIPFSDATDGVLDNYASNPIPLFLQTAAIYLRGCNPQVINNKFYYTKYGAILVDSEADGSNFSGNEINHTDQAMVIEGNNLGLTTKCNHLINYSQRGIRIKPWSVLPGDPGDGDLGQQGDCDNAQPAAYTFSPATGTGIKDIQLQTQTNDFILHDQTIPPNISENPPTTGDFIPFTGSGCVDINLIDYCEDLLLTTIADIQLMPDGIEKDKQLAIYLLELLDKEDYTAAINWVYAYNTKLNMQRRLVANGIEKDSLLQEAKNILPTLPNNSEEDLRYKQLHQLLIDLKDSNRTVFDLTEAEHALLDDIAHSRTKTAFKAQTLLYIVYAEEFPAMLPDDGLFTVFKQDNTPALATTNAIVPNPNQGNMTFQYQLNAPAHLYIYDMLGRLCYVSPTLSGKGSCAIDLSDHATGLYVGQLLSTDKQLTEQYRFQLIR